MSKVLNESLVTRPPSYGPFVVVDDGQPSKRYSVWCKLANGQASFITSGAVKENALATAEALNKTNPKATGMILE